MVIEQLRLDTHAAHIELERTIMPYLRNVQSSTAYHHLLALFYGFYQPVYQQIDQYITPAILPDYYSRRRPGSLLNDGALQAQSNGQALPLCTDIPVITNAAQALGALYVLEGSTLGGTVICKMLKEKLGITSNDQFTFFYNYGPGARDKWTIFGEAINDFAATSGQHTRIVEAAQATFIKFKNWINQQTA